MNKILLVIQREYLTRVRKKSFIIMSIIGPLLIASLWAIPIWLATRDTEQRTIDVVDESGFFVDKFPENESLNFNYINLDIAEAKKKLTDNNTYGLLYIPPIDIDNPRGITFFSETNPSIDVIGSLERVLKNNIEEMKLVRSSIDRETLEGLKADVSIDTINMTDAGEKAGSAGVATVIGYIAAIMIYFFIFIYGIQILRGVIEEKSSRIIEIIVSSVRPFQLMMGKIIGVGAVGLTQFLIWIFLGFGITSVVGSYFNINRNETIVAGAHMNEAQDENAELVAEIFNSLETIDIPLLLFAFLFYFLGAYLLYGSLFAAVGSAVDNDTDAQQFQLPITIPLIFSLIVLSAVLREPDGNFAFWLSMIPLTSPITMMMRIPFGVPFWEVMLSMFLLILGFILSTWVASRIYRIGILMHGAKVNYRILGKWLFMKN
ncbi:MAG: ABC transporter permease [Cyclobacteriaceae bacterium]|nr:ABC transporter permease [Cyclobacteriaceae bacterium]